MAFIRNSADIISDQLMDNGSHHPGCSIRRAVANQFKRDPRVTCIPSDDGSTRQY